MTPWLLVSGDFVKTGGMDRANYALARYLAGRGQEVHLVAHRADEDLLRMDNVTLHAARKPLNSYYLGRRWIDRLGRQWAAKIAARGGRVIVNGGNCQWADVNWVHYVHAAYRPETAGSRVKRWVAGWKRRAFLNEERTALREARVVIANSLRTQEDVVRTVGVHEDRVKTVYLGTDPADIRPASAAERAATRALVGWPVDGAVAIFVGALGDRRKNFDTVLSAWQLLNGRGMDCTLAVVGQGAELPAWQARAAEAGLAGKIHFMGFRKDAAALIRAADVMVAPARYEPYGLSVHEALCSGIPAIVSACSGVCERFPLELRDLVVHDEGHAEQLAGRVMAWWGSRQRCRAVMLGVSQSLRQRTWDKMAEEMVRVIESAGGQNDRPAMKMSA